MEKTTYIKFRLASIKNEKSSAIPRNVDFSGITEESLQVQYRVKTVINLPDKCITVTPGIRYSYKGTVVFESSADFNYAVPAIESAMDIDMESRTLDMKVNILPGMVGAAYSSLRGIVYFRTLGTPLESYPVPLIDTEQLLSKNGISILQEKG